MLFKNPETLIVLEPSHVSYFVRLESASTFINEDWLAEHVDLQLIEDMTLVSLNASMQPFSQIKTLRRQICAVRSYLIYSHELFVYLIGNNKLVLEITYDIKLEIEGAFRRKKHSRLKCHELFGQLNVQVDVHYQKVVNIKVQSLTLK